MSRTRVLVTVTGLGSLVFISAVLGATALGRLTGGATVTFFVGFLAFPVIGMTVD